MAKIPLVPVVSFVKAFDDTIPEQQWSGFSFVHALTTMTSSWTRDIDQVIFP